MAPAPEQTTPATGATGAAQSLAPLEQEAGSPSSGTATQTLSKIQASAPAPSDQSDPAPLPVGSGTSDSDMAAIRAIRPRSVTMSPNDVALTPLPLRSEGSTPSGTASNIVVKEGNAAAGTSIEVATTSYGLTGYPANLTVTRRFPPEWEGERQSVLSRLDNVESTLRLLQALAVEQSIERQRGVMGDNNPPEPIDDVRKPTMIGDGIIAVGRLRTELQSDIPDLEIIALCRRV